MVFLHIILFVIGLVLVAKGADWVTDYAAKLARKVGISELIIGIVLVAIATTLPELTVSVLSAITANVDIATGTIIGSNITNIALILGVAALISPLATSMDFVHKDYFMLLLTCLLALLMIGGLVWFEGLILIAGMLLFMVYLVKVRKPKRPNIITHLSDFIHKTYGKKRGATKLVVFCLIGGVFVVFGARLLIISTIGIAGLLGIPEILIAMIVIAFGTSVPELATVMTAAWKGLKGIAIGNIIGANVFNISTLGIVSLIHTVPVSQKLIMVNIPMMLVLALLLLVFIRTGWRFSRKEGFVLLVLYGAFIALQFLL
jgi:cation:H+ antiporter